MARALPHLPQSFEFPAVQPRCFPAQVVNAADTLSFNHNWINGYNAHWSWALLMEEYRVAESLLEDCRDLSTGPAEFQGLVHRNVAMNAGFELASFGAGGLLGETEAGCCARLARPGPGLQPCPAIPSGFIAKRALDEAGDGGPRGAVAAQRLRQLELLLLRMLRDMEAEPVGSVLHAQVLQPDLPERALLAEVQRGIESPQMR